MDFTPVNLSGIPGIKRKTTKGFELSLSVLFLSGIQHFAESDSGMLKQKDFAIDFLKQLPDSWDDVKFIDGFPGKYVVLARRSGENWYIAGINGENKESAVEMDLSFIVGKHRNAYIITDNSTADELVYNKFSIEKFTKVMMKPYGGFVIKIESK
jgi:hypothetical protein